MTGEFEKYESFPPELALDDAPGPAAHITRGGADGLIETALREAGFGEGAVPETPRKKRRAAAFFQVAAVATLACLGIGSASAAVMWFQKRMSEPAPAAVSVPERAHRPRPRLARPEAPPALVPAPVEEAQAPDRTLEEAPHESANKRAPRVAEDFLDRANQLRARGAWRAADEAYESVWRSSPKSSAAYVARVASAAVRLEHLRDPKTALARYRAALTGTPRGPLTEEIRYGVAECYRALGQRANERAALERFVDEHPDSGLAAKARARLLSLDAR